MQRVSTLGTEIDKMTELCRRVNREHACQKGVSKCQIFSPVAMTRKGKLGKTPITSSSTVLFFFQDVDGQVLGARFAGKFRVRVVHNMSCHLFQSTRREESRGNSDSS